jgi:hypothetical protein
VLAVFGKSYCPLFMRSSEIRFNDENIHDEIYKKINLTMFEI